MIKAEDLRINIVIIDSFGEQKILDEDLIESLMAARNFEDLKPLPLTKEILKNNFGFKIHDMGDFWQCELDQFVLIQPKLHGLEMPFVFGYKTLVSKSVAFNTVHELQNFYYQIEQKELLWK